MYFTANYGYAETNFCVWLQLTHLRFNFTLWHCCGYGLVRFSYNNPLSYMFWVKIHESVATNTAGSLVEHHLEQWHLT